MIENCIQRHKFSDRTLTYQQFGNGNRVLLCFHGFGEDATKYRFLAESFGGLYTIYSFDFFYHGDNPYTGTPGDLTLEKNLWSGIITDFMSKKNIDKVNLLGYSMGGRLSLALLEKIPESIDRIILLAPDGIQKSFWFDFSTQNFIGKSLFRRFTYHPKSFLGVFKMLIKLRIIPKKLSKIVLYHTKSKEKREQVYNTWNVLSGIALDLSLIESMLNNYNIPLYIIIGYYDKVIVPSKVKEWNWLKVNPSKFHLVQEGHILSEAQIVKSIRQNGMLR